MRSLTRRDLLKAAGGLALGGAAVSAYGIGIEPIWRLNIASYALTPAKWPSDLKLRIAAIADMHACEPFMSLDHIERIVDATNALQPDLVVLLGDFEAKHRFVTKLVPGREWAGKLSQLKAPLGAYAVLGNHDWWDETEAQRRQKGPVLVRRYLESQNIPVLENQAVRLVKIGKAFWLLGLADQLALIRRHGDRRYSHGLHDLPATLGQVSDDAPAILLAHEPDIFPKVPERIALTRSGHTHGGQIRMLGYSPLVPSRYGNRYAYGHVQEDGHSLIVSGGLGESRLPVRLGVPPEVVVVDIGTGAAGSPVRVAS